LTACQQGKKRSQTHYHEIIMKNSEFFRLFFAISFNQAMQESLKQLMNPLKKLSHIHWEPVENLHITLHFMGNVAQAKIPDLLHEVQKNITELPVFDIEFLYLQYFPQTKHPRVLSIVIRPSPKLIKLVTQIGKGIVACDLPIQDRPYIPHITLGRLKLPPHPPVFERQAVKLPPFTATHITLFQSVTTEIGSKYIGLEKLNLGNDLA
jgi:2'-5' RNA ligase